MKNISNREFVSADCQPFRFHYLDEEFDVTEKQKEYLVKITKVEWPEGIEIHNAVIPYIIHALVRTQGGAGPWANTLLAAANNEIITTAILDLEKSMKIDLVGKWLYVIVEYNPADPEART